MEEWQPPIWFVFALGVLFAGLAAVGFFRGADPKAIAVMGSLSAVFLGISYRNVKPPPPSPQDRPTPPSAQGAPDLPGTLMRTVEGLTTGKGVSDG